MRILFTHSYFLHFDKKQLNTFAPYPPLATLYAASLLQKNGHEVKIADLQFSDSEMEIANHIDEFKPELFVICDDSFNYLTKMCLTNMREAAFSMQRIAKNNKLPVIVSSSDASDHIDAYCRNGADFIITGETEMTLLELTTALKTGSNTRSIKGLAFNDGDKIIKNPAREVIKDLDILPKPNWNLIDPGLYKKTWLKKQGYFSLNFVTTRGCPYKCNWCAKPIYGNRYNTHSPEYIVNLIKETQAKLNFSHIWFADDIFGLKPGWTGDFAALIKKENIKIKYKIQSRADLLLEEENIRHLAESGCDTVWLGAESGSQRILDAMDKGITVQEISKAVHLLKKHGIKPALFLQFGYLNEKAEDIKKTIDMVNLLLPADIGISVSYPLPGTKFYNKVKEQLQDKANWTDSDDLHLLFKNTYTAEFYRHLHKYVHYNFRAKQSISQIRSLSGVSYKKLFLLPYYKMKSIFEKRALIKIDPVAARGI